MIDTKDLRRLVQAATPGPWEVAYTDQNGQAVVKGEHIEIATCWHHCVGSIEKEMYANAALIAAANPAAISELLDRLEAWENVFGHLGTPDEVGNEWLSLSDRLEAAESELLEQARLNGMGGEREAALLTKLEAAEKAVTEAYQRGYATGQEEIGKERDALRVEVERLTECLHRANAQAEHFEREWYLRGEEVDALRAKIEAMEKQMPSHWGCTVLQSDGRWKEEVSREAPPEGYFSIRNIFPLYALPGAQAQPAQNVPDDVVEQAVNRFLSWKLPKDFHPDGGMVFIPTKRRGYDSPHWPVGTNLLNAQQAREMLRYVLAAAPEAKP